MFEKQVCNLFVVVLALFIHLALGIHECNHTGVRSKDGMSRTFIMEEHAVLVGHDSSFILVVFFFLFFSFFNFLTTICCCY